MVFFMRYTSWVAALVKGLQSPKSPIDLEDDWCRKRDEDARGRHGVHICWLIEAGYGKYVENMVIYGKYMGHMVIYGCLPSGNLTICY